MTQELLPDSAANLARLTQKPGVKGTLVLARETGAIVRASGPIFSKEHGDMAGREQSLSKDVSEETKISKSAGYETTTGKVAHLVMKFVGSAGHMVQDMDAEDDVKLLRIRTKKLEYVIVPGS